MLDRNMAVRSGYADCEKSGGENGRHAVLCQQAGRSTTFTLSLSFRICHAPEKRNKPKRLLQTSSIAGLHVLVAEDNRMNMEIAEFVLNVEEAPSSRQ